MGRTRRLLARSEHPAARALRAAYRGWRGFTLPTPGVVVRPLLWAYLTLRTIHHFFKRVLVCEPLFKAYCTRYGRGVRTGVFVHWIQGEGAIILGDGVHFDGKSSIAFAARYSDRPTLLVGDHTGISHNCTITVASLVEIGRHCRIASDVFIFDCAGHSSDPEARRRGAPADDDEVRPVTIGDDVWIGRRAIIFPGVTVGQGSIVSSGAVVMNDVAPFTVVAGNPARKIGSTRRAPQPDPQPTH